MSTTTSDNIVHANIGFDHVFSNDLEAAKEQFSTGDSAPHLMGLGCIVFLQAALGMEVDLINEASRLLTLTEAKSRKEYKAAKATAQTRRFPPGLEFEVLQADTMLLLGLAQALSESYTGYLQCMYSLNSAHSKFTKIFNTAFPDGVNNYATPSSSPAPSRKPSNADINRSLSLPPFPISASTPTLAPIPTRVGFFGRWNSSSKVPSISSTSTPIEPDGPVEELIIAGAAFGYGLFNLVFSLLPPKLRGVVGFLGFKSDRQLALRALAVAATKNDAHAVFAGLTLMTYHGAVLLLSGYQADEAHILRQYKAIVNKLQNRYPSGSLWILNNAKILSLSGDSDGAIAILKAGLSSQRSHNFRQADALLVFELSWTLFSQRKYEEAAQMFLQMTEINTWSHATYYYLAAGCLISIGNYEKAQELLDQVPCLMEKRKLAGRELPTEILIKKRIAFYKAKQLRQKGPENQYAQCIHLSISEVWNAHHRISAETAEAHIREWINVSPRMIIEGSHIQFPSLSSKESYDLDTADELALRSLLLGVVHKSLNRFNEARTLLMDVGQHNVESKWYKVLALFELAVIRLRETDHTNSVANDSYKDLWDSALKDAGELLNKAAEISATTEVSSRIESRISMLRDEIALKRQRTGKIHDHVQVHGNDREDVTGSVTIALSTDMLVVGLTGGIATGKSTVSGLLKSHNITVIDADILAREVVQPGTRGLRKIVAEFGSDILNPDGSLDRVKLGNIIFNNEGKRKKLNGIVHPAVRRAMFWGVFRSWLRGDNICVLDVPLLIEVGLWKWMGVIASPSSGEVQLRRLMKRDGSREDSARARLESQMPISNKLQYADYVVDNSGSIKDMDDQIGMLIKRLNQQSGWFWMASWLFPPLGILSAGWTLLWRNAIRPRRKRRS